MSGCRPSRFIVDSLASPRPPSPSPARVRIAPHVIQIALAACMLIAPGLAAAQACVDAPAGLVGWWPGDGDAVDLVWQRDARLVGGAGFAPGLVGDAFALDGFAGGQDDAVLLPHDRVEGLSDLTVELWVNTTDEAGGLLSGANGAPNGSNELLLYVQSAAGITPWIKERRIAEVPAPIADGAWHHLAFTRLGGQGSLYLDGRLVAVQDFPTGVLDLGPNGLQIGQEQDCLGGCLAPDQALDALVDEVSIYGRALDAAEVAAIFDAGAAGKCKPEAEPDPGSEPPPVLLEELDALRMELEMLNERVALQDQAIVELEARAGDDDDDDDDHEECRARRGHDPARDRHRGKHFRRALRRGHFR